MEYENEDASERRYGAIVKISLCGWVHNAITILVFQVNWDNNWEQRVRPELAWFEVEMFGGMFCFLLLDTSDVYQCWYRCMCIVLYRCMTIYLY